MLAKEGASLGIHPKVFGPTSVQFKGEINDTLPRKRHQKRHLEFCTAYLLSRRSGVRIPPGAPFFSITWCRFHGAPEVHCSQYLQMMSSSLQVAAATPNSVVEVSERRSSSRRLFQTIHHPCSFLIICPLISS
jgi:hypothetical protein